MGEGMHCINYGFILHPRFDSDYKTRRSLSDNMCVFWNVPVKRNKEYWQEVELSLRDAKAETIRHFVSSPVTTSILIINEFGGWREFYVQKINPSATLLDGRLYQNINRKAKLSSLWIETPPSNSSDLGFNWPVLTQIGSINFDGFITDPLVAPKVLAIPLLDEWIEVNEDQPMASLLQAYKESVPDFSIFYFSYIPSS